MSFLCSQHVRSPTTHQTQSPCIEALTVQFHFATFPPPLTPSTHPKLPPWAYSPFHAFLCLFRFYPPGKTSSDQKILSFLRHTSTFASPLVGTLEKVSLWLKSPQQHFVTTYLRCLPCQAYSSLSTTSEPPGGQRWESKAGVLYLFDCRTPLFSMIFKDSKELLFMWILSTDIYHIKN